MWARSVQAACFRAAIPLVATLMFSADAYATETAMGSCEAFNSKTP